MKLNFPGVALLRPDFCTDGMAALCMGTSDAVFAMDAGVKAVPLRDVLAPCVESGPVDETQCPTDQAKSVILGGSGPTRETTGSGIHPRLVLTTCEPPSTFPVLYK